MKRPPLVPAYRVLSMPGSMAREKTSTCARGRPALMGLQLFPPFVLLNRPSSFLASWVVVGLSASPRRLEGEVCGRPLPVVLYLFAAVVVLKLSPSVHPISV